jgi:pathogenesis-related protein 1
MKKNIVPILVMFFLTSIFLSIMGVVVSWSYIEDMFLGKPPAPTIGTFDGTIVSPSSPPSSSPSSSPSSPPSVPTPKSSPPSVPTPKSSPPSVPAPKPKSPSKKPDTPPKKPDATPPKKPDETPPKKPDQPITPPKKPDQPITPPKKPDQPITPPKKPDVTPIVSSDILEFHNQVRARHGAAPLVWNDGIAQHAQTWANLCTLKHGSSDAASYGQNLAHGHSDQIAAAQAWYNEYKDIQAAGYDMTKGGHFTQMAWKTVKEMGCGKAMCPLPDWNGALGPYYVCEYNPPGNVAWPGDEQRSYREHVQVDPSY